VIDLALEALCIDEFLVVVLVEKPDRGLEVGLELVAVLSNIVQQTD